MGNHQSTLIYAKQTTQKIPGQSPVYRNAIIDKKQLTTGPSPNVQDMKSALLHSFKEHKQIDGLGTIVRKQGQPDFIKYKKYGQIHQQSIQLGSGIINQNLAHQQEGKNLNFIGIFSKNRYQWTLLDCACILYKITTIPLYDTLGDQNISYVFQHTQLTTVFVNDVSLKALMKTKDLVNVKTIVSFDPYSNQQVEYFKQKGVEIKSLQSIIDSGKSKKIDYNQQKYATKPDDCITFCYTSGVTGPPKGAMLSHKNFISFVSALLIDNKQVNLQNNDIVLSYLPLPHVLQRQVIYAILYMGAKAVFYSGDVSKIKDDLALVKPTIFVSVPRLFSRFYDAVNKKLNQLTGYTKKALDHALSKKLQNVTTTGQYVHKIYDKIFFNKTKAALGGNCRLMISGSAPLLPQVHKFLKVTMCCPLLQGYGQTQSTGASYITAAKQPLLGHVGGPSTNIEVKLVDIPQMSYTSDDKDQNGNSMPRGQIWFRGPGVFLGYYKDQQKTSQALTQDGWLKSGDVGAVLPQTKCLKIIDRKKNIFKLSQGQYVASQKVQNIYLNHPVIQQIFIHGDSSQSYAIVIMSANKKILSQIAKQLNIEGTHQQLCANLKVRTQVLKRLNVIGKQKGLKGFQLARNIFIDPNGFASRNILTNTLKVQRHQARKSFAQQVVKMYKQGMLGGDRK